jgi:hypothetical protein
MSFENIQIHDLNLFREGGSYIDSIRLFFAYTKEVASIKAIRQINAKKARKWLESEWAGEITKRHNLQRYNRDTKVMGYVDAIYLFKNGLMVNIECDSIFVLHIHTDEEIALDFINQCIKFRTRNKTTNHISLVVRTGHGFDTAEMKMSNPKLDITKNYNHDLLAMNDNIVKRLNQKNKSGLILFHGLPGTGKTTYIRHLINKTNKKVIFIPPGLAGELDSPNIISLLLENPNSVFVIEDAEQLLVSRDNQNNSYISLILNLTDGILGEGLGIQVIATFNTDLSNIDKALLRKGRLLALYDFKALSVEKSKILLNNIGEFDHQVTSPMTLADIYNIKENPSSTSVIKKNSIGFFSNNN